MFRETIDNHSVVSVSIGAAWEEKDYNLEELVKYADSLMYANKQIYYSSIGSVNYNKNTAMTSKLLNDLNMGNYLIYLHPKMNVDNNAIVGAEATIRSLGADGNAIVPEFITPICNHEGAAFHIDFFALDKICKLISELEAKGKNIGNFTIYFSQITLLECNAVKHMQDRKSVV